MHFILRTLNGIRIRHIASVVCGQLHPSQCKPHASGSHIKTLLKVKDDWNQIVEFWHKVHIWSKQCRNPQATELLRSGETQGHLSIQLELGSWISA